MSVAVSCTNAVADLVNVAVLDVVAENAIVGVLVFEGDRVTEGNVSVAVF